MLLIENSDKAGVQKRNRNVQNLQVTPVPLIETEVKETSLATQNPLFAMETGNIRRRTAKGKNSAIRPLDGTSLLQKSTNFLGILYNLIRITNIFRFRTKFRNTKYVDDERLKLMNDCSYFPEKKQKEFSSLKRYVEKNTLKKIYYYFLYYLSSVEFIGKFSEKAHFYIHELNSRIPVIKPNQKAKIIWDVLILIIIVFFFFVIPMQISLDIFYDEQFLMLMEEKNMSMTLAHYLLMIPEIIMIIDTLLKFITGYYEQGIIIMSKEKIIKKYLKKGLIFDILSYCPILLQAFYKDYIFKKTDNFGLILKFLQLLVFCKLKRINTLLRNFEDVICLNGKHDYLLNLVRISFRIVFVAHLNACIWHACAYYYDGNNTWLVYAQISDGKWTEKYWTSMYWAVSAMVTVGFGEKVSPQNNLELFIGVVILLISAYIFGYTLNAMRQIFNLMSRNEAEFKETISIINQFMKKKNIEFELQGRVRKFLEYTMDKERNSDKEIEILNKLTSSLRNEVLLQSHGNILTKIPFFTKNFTAGTVQALSFCMRKVKFSPEEYIYKINEIDDSSLYIIEKGEVEEVLTNENLKGRSVIKLYKRGEPFGLRSFFSSEKRDFSVISRNFSTIFEIKKKDFMDVLEKNPKDKETYCMIKQEMQLLDFSPRLGISCEACQKKNHLLSLCPLLHYIPDRSFLISKLLHSEENSRKLMNRKAHRGRSALKHWNSIKENAKTYELSSSSDSDSEEEEEKNEAKQSEIIQKDNHRLSDSLDNKNSNHNRNLAPIKEIDEHCAEEAQDYGRKLPSEERPFLKESEQEWTFKAKSMQIPSLLEIPSHSKNSIILPRKSRKSTQNSMLNVNSYNNMLKGIFPRGSSISYQTGTQIKMKMIDSLAEALKATADLFFFDMDVMCTFTLFYPHNNAENVINNLQKVRRKSRKKTLKMHFK